VPIVPREKENILNVDEAGRLFKSEGREANERKKGEKLMITTTQKKAGG
jgi:hypothetical protein